MKLEELVNIFKIYSKSIKRETIFQSSIDFQNLVEEILNRIISEIKFKDVRIKKSDKEISNKDKQIEELNQQILRCKNRCEEYIEIGMSLECQIHAKNKEIEVMAKDIYESDTIFYLPKDVNSVETVKEYYKNKAKES